MNPFLPQPADNQHRGHPLALWILGAVLLLKIGISLGSVFSGRDAAVNADGIPLDTFSPAGADAFVTLLAAMGFALFLISALGVLVLVRYRSLVPLMYAVVLVEHLGRRLIFWLMPIAKTGGMTSSIINPLLVALMIVGLALSLWNRGRT